MNPINDTVKYSVYGFGYSLVMQTLLYPGEVVKLRQQDPLCHQRCDQIVRELFQKGGVRAFYTGFPAKLAETGHKHFWRWPVIMQLPPLLEERGYNEKEQQMITGGVIGTITAGFGTPLDAFKIAAIRGLEKRVSNSVLKSIQI